MTQNDRLAELARRYVELTDRAGRTRCRCSDLTAQCPATHSGAQACLLNAFSTLDTISAQPDRNAYLDKQCEDCPQCWEALQLIRAAKQIELAGKRTLRAMKNMARKMTAAYEKRLEPDTDE